jgi:UDP-N-acetylmuramyl-tripeptide synthetase
VKLSELITGIETVDRSSLDKSGAAAQARPDPEITSIHYRSQEVVPGGLFVAIAGLQADGHDYIEDAFSRGAAAAVTQKAVAGSGLTIQVADSRRALADLASRFYRWPAEKLVVIGITGTNGKTTTAYLIEGILASAGFEVGVIGTIDYRYGGRSHANPVTTPESLDLERILSGMAAAGVTHVVVEVSSHAIALGRSRNLWLDAAVFTNLSQDHLDFHGDMRTYWNCKKSLFTDHLVRGPKSDHALAVVNTANEYGRKLAGSIHTAIVTVGTDETAHIYADGIDCGPDGIKGRFTTRRGQMAISSRLVGLHNVENLLCAVGVGEALSLPLAAVTAGIEQMPYVPGRLEPIENRSGCFVYVDYAHTPDALENVLEAVGAIANGRIICVFGCGGDRDRGKRPLMGAIAARKSDLAIVTSDNPRTEDPLEIIEEIEAGIRPLGIQGCETGAVTSGFECGRYVVEADRRSAIRLAVRAARPGDIVLIAGKGHETYQILGRRTIDFDDRHEAREALKALEAEKG